MMQTLAALVPELPEGGFWVPLLVLHVLGLVALYDARKGRVPDEPVFFTLLATIGAFGFYMDWPLAAERLMVGIAAMLILWATNQLYYKIRKTDAIGMGDAKWTLLAATTFGARPALIAWIVGAWVAVATMGALYALRRAKAGKEAKFPAQIHFAPFLFIGLLVGLFARV